MSALKVGTCGLRGCHTNDNAHALYFCPPFGLIPFLPLEDIVFARVSVKVPRMTETLQAAFSNKSPSEKTLVRPNDPSSLSHVSSQNPSWLLFSLLPSNRVNLSHNSLCHSKGKTQSHHDVVVVVVGRRRFQRKRTRCALTRIAQPRWTTTRRCRSVDVSRRRRRRRRGGLHAKLFLCAEVKDFKIFFILQRCTRLNAEVLHYSLFIRKKV